jgi:hypothetical protein
MSGLRTDRNQTGIDEAMTSYFISIQVYNNLGAQRLANLLVLAERRGTTHEKQLHMQSDRFAGLPIIPSHGSVEAEAERTCQPWRCRQNP